MPSINYTLEQVPEFNVDSLAVLNANIAMFEGKYVYAFSEGVLYYVKDSVAYPIDGQGGGLPADAEPTGFFDRFQSTITFNPLTRIFTISAVNPSGFDIYFSNQKATYVGSTSITLANQIGLQFIYFDADTRLLTSRTSFTEDLITKHVYVSAIFLRSSENPSLSLDFENEIYQVDLSRDFPSTVYFADERHGLVMDSATHLHLHSTLGAQYVSGLGLQNILADDSGNLDSSMQLAVQNGIIRDEDIKITIVDNSPQDLSVIANIPILYRIGSSVDWRRTKGSAYPVIQPADAAYVTSGRIAYNLNTSGVWSLEEVTNNSFTLIHILATNDVEYPIQGIQGGLYSSITSARNNAVTEFATFSGLPFNEFVLIGTIIVQAANSYTNAPKARIRKTEDGFDYVDWRKANTFNISASGGTTSVIPSSTTQRTFGFFIG